MDKTIGDNVREPDETVNISPAEGAIMCWGSVVSKMDTFKNDDHSKTAIITNGPMSLCVGQTLTLSTKATIDGEAV